MATEAASKAATMITDELGLRSGFTRNWESSSSSALQSIVSMTDSQDAYKSDIPMKWPRAMATAMMIMNSNRK